MKFNTLQEVLAYVPIGDAYSDTLAFNAVTDFVVINLSNPTVGAIAITHICVDWMGLENVCSIPESIVLDYLFEYLTPAIYSKFLQNLQNPNLIKDNYSIHCDLIKLNYHNANK